MGFQDAEIFYKDEAAEARAYWDHLAQSEEEGVAEVKRWRAATAASKEALGGGGAGTSNNSSNISGSNTTE